MAFARLPWHAAESGDSRAAKQMVNHGLRLIVEVMSCGQHIHPMGQFDAFQFTISSHSRDVFSRAAFLFFQGGHVDVDDVTRNIQRRREFGHPACILVGFTATKAMVDVGNSERKMQFRREGLENERERHTIRAARDCKQSRSAWNEQLVVSNAFSHAAHERIAGRWEVAEHHVGPSNCRTEPVHSGLQFIVVPKRRQYLPKRLVN